MITREADYGIRTILYLATQQNETGSARISTRDLAREMSIPYRFLRNIIRKLVDAGLVNSQRGKGGGLKLGLPKEKLSLLDVLQVMDRDGIRLNDCLADEFDCPRIGTCPVHRTMAKIQHVLNKELAKTTFDQLAAEEK
jgi:Rrf2 family iron-responsive transcriptional regulator